MNVMFNYNKILRWTNLKRTNIIKGLFLIYLHDVYEFYGQIGKQ